ncbi:MAG: hypothetical protein BWY57_03370 [Betaproteobacteria bacterium ADurb.Bin341]|nr:MAG: hypothetical protein BWY57_03370 [Betaproteobacteria bacterium ADurb.Bin341]
MHHQREAGQQFLDLLKNVEAQFLVALELERAVRGADRAGQRVAAGLLDEGFGLLGLGVDMLVGRDILFHAFELAQFCLDHDALGVGGVHDALGDLDVLLERIVRGVDHDGAVDAGGDAVHAGLLVTVVQMHREDGIREDLVGRGHHHLEHQLVRIRARALGKLHDEGGFALDVAFEQAHGLLEVVDVVRADRILAIGLLKKFFCSDDHGQLLWLFRPARPATHRRADTAKEWPYTIRFAGRGGKPKPGTQTGAQTRVRGASPVH